MKKGLRNSLQMMVTYVVHFTRSLRPSNSSLDRKIASSTCNQACRDRHFSDLQYCMGKGGLEKIIHSFRSVVEVKPELDIFAMDGDNAFNKLDRGIALQAVKSHYPAYLPLLRTMYGSKSTAWFTGKEDGIDFINSTTGVHQD